MKLWVLAIISRMADKFDEKAKKGDGMKIGKKNCPEACFFRLLSNKRSVAYPSIKRVLLFFSGSKRWQW